MAQASLFQHGVDLNPRKGNFKDKDFLKQLKAARQMVELSWLWLRWQPESRTAKWYHEHVGKDSSRSKRKAIGAVARKLLVESWHFVEHGVVPTGAVLKIPPTNGREVLLTGALVGI